MDKSVMADFTQQTGIKVKIAKLGDAGEMTNKLILTKSAPIADGVFGLNNPLLVRALENGILTEVDVDVPDSAYDEAKRSAQTLRRRSTSPMSVSMWTSLGLRPRASRLLAGLLT
ncbi:MAG: hypothetical protein R2709_01110 [Marmoricola sp.]